MLKVWILVKSVLKIERLVSQLPQSFIRQEQQQCFFGFNTKGGDIYLAFGVFSLFHLKLTACTLHSS